MEKRISPPLNSTSAIGRALPDMPTNWPTSVDVPECRTSSQALLSPSGRWIVMSQRPMIAGGADCGAP